MDEEGDPFGAHGETSELARPGKRTLVLMALVVFFVLIVTPAISLTLLSVQGSSGTIVIEPGSHYAMHFGFHGIGKLEHSFTVDSGTQIFMVEVDKRNYERLVDGKSYSYSGYQTLGIGGNGRSMSLGFMWDAYYVLVNEGSTLAVIEYDVDATSCFNVIAAGAILVVAGAAYALNVYWVGGKERGSRPPLSREGLREREKALAVIAGLVILPVVIMVVLGMVIPTALSPLFGLAGMLVSTALAFLVRFRLKVVNGEPRQVLADLAHRLRVSRYSVTEKPHLVSVQVSSSAATKIMAKQLPEGTMITYRAGATHSGLATILVLILFGYGIPIALAVVLFSLYRSAVFASDRVLPRLSRSPLSETSERKSETRAILIDSLSEGRRLSSEAHEATKSNYEDAIIVLVTIGIVLSMVLALIVGLYSLRASLVVGVAFSILFSILSWRFLAVRTKPRLEELRDWKTRFDLALSREIASQSPPDGDPSSFELIAESIREFPRWLKILEKSGLYREPVHWLLIFNLCITALALVYVGVSFLFSDDLLSGSIFISVSAALPLLSWALYRWLKRRREEESKEVLGGWVGRFESLKSEMETYLRSV